MLTHFDDFCASGFANYDFESATVHLVFAMTEVGGPLGGLVRYETPSTTTLGCSEPNWRRFC